MKKAAIIICLISILVLQGCERRSVEDVYSIIEEETNNRQEEINNKGTEQQIVDDITNNKGYSDMNDDSIPEFIEQGEKVRVTTEKADIMLSFQVEDVLATHNINDLIQLSDEEAVSNVKDYFINIDNSNYISSDGTLNQSRRGINYKAVLVKMLIINESTDDYKLVATAFDMYDIKDNSGVLQYRKLQGECKLMDKPDSFDRKECNKITLKAGESKEETLIYVVEDTWVQSETYHIEDGQWIYDELVTGGSSINNVCISTNFLGSSNSTDSIYKNKYMLKLNLRYAD